jgi:multidrug efflux system membrane fusion protein
MAILSKSRRYIAEHPYIIALTILVVLVLWMLSGTPDKQQANEDVKQLVPLAKVQVTTMAGEKVQRTVSLYGRTEPNRTVQLKAEVKGKIEKILVERGAFVKAGEPLVRIALNDLQAKLTQAKALLKQRQIAYQGSQALSSQGFQGEVKLAESLAQLEAVKAEIARLELDLDNTVIRAPFDGMLNERSVELGDYVGIGDDIAQIADLDPLIIRAYATENQVSELSVNQAADIQLLGKPQVIGKLRYIASVADENTNTFKLEVAIANGGYKLLAGISSEVNISLEEVDAIKVSPALLACCLYANRDG